MRSKSSPSSKRFICDEQLGRLAKWLRLQGFDTLFECPLEDAKLIRLAQSEGRILLTRDRHLSAKTLFEPVVIQATHYAEQLRELKKRVKLPRGLLFSRCLDCNQLVRPLPKEKARTRVPVEVYRSYKHFTTCPTCQKIFWRGSHVKMTEARLRRLRLRR